MDDIEAWVEWMQAQSWSTTTIKARVALVERVAKEAGLPPIELRARDVRTFLAGQSFGNSSRRTYWNSLRSWFKWLLESGRIVDDPMGTVAKPNVGRRSIRVVTTEHVRALLNSGIHARTRTMVLLAAYQGLRASEIARVRGSDVDVASGTLHVVGKGDVHADVPLHPLVAAEAAKYGRGWWFPQYVGNASGAGGGPILGESVTGVVAAAMRRAGIPGTCHSLRHWYATELLRAGVDIRTLQQLTRHATLSSVELYLHVDDSQRRAGVLLLPGVSPIQNVPVPVGSPAVVPTATPAVEMKPQPRLEHGPRCPDICPGHGLIDKISTDVELAAFDGPGHMEPMVRVLQSGQEITLSYSQLQRLSELAGRWRDYGRDVDRGRFRD